MFVPPLPESKQAKELVSIPSMSPRGLKRAAQNGGTQHHVVYSRSSPTNRTSSKSTPPIVQPFTIVQPATSSRRSTSPRNNSPWHIQMIAPSSISSPCIQHVESAPAARSGSAGSYIYQPKATRAALPATSAPPLMPTVSSAPPKMPIGSAPAKGDVHTNTVSPCQPERSTPSARTKLSFIGTVCPNLASISPTNVAKSPSNEDGVSWTQRLARQGGNVLSVGKSLNQNLMTKNVAGNLRAGVGIFLQYDTSSANIYVAGIKKGGPAHTCGRINVFDVLIGIDGVEVNAEYAESTSSDGLLASVQDRVLGTPGSSILMTFERRASDSSGACTDKQQSYQRFDVNLERVGAGMHEVNNRSAWLTWLLDEKSSMLEDARNEIRVLTNKLDDQAVCIERSAIMQSDLEHFRLKTELEQLKLRNLEKSLQQIKCQNEILTAENEQMKDEARELRNEVRALQNFILSEKESFHIEIQALKDQALAAKFEVWVQSVRKKKQIMKAQFDDKQRSENLVKLLEGHRMQGVLSHLLDTWKAHVQRLRKNRRMCIRSIQRWTRQKVWTAFSSWHHLARKQKHAKAICSRALQRLKNLTIARAFDFYTKRVQGQSRLRWVCLSIIRKLKNAGARRAFFAWVANSKKKRRMKDLCKHAVARWNHMGLASAVQSWLSNARLQRRSAEMCTRSILRMLNRLIYVAWNGWSGKVAANRRAKALILRNVLLMLNRLLKRSFSTWLANAVTTLQQRKFLVGIICKWTHAFVSTAFKGWYDGALRQRYMTRTLFRAVGRWRKLRLGYAFDALFENFKEQRLQRNMLKLVCGRNGVLPCVL